MDTDTPQSAPKRRRRFQFRFRTLFIVMTLVAVVCGYVGHQAQKVAHRRQLYLHLSFEGKAFGTICGPPGATAETAPDLSLSWLRQELGDFLLVYIRVDKTVTEEDFIDLRDSFPEAVVERVE
jgi:hypothetical protein